jgi:hypothetical protein
MTSTSKIQLVAMMTTLACGTTTGDAADTGSSGVVEDSTGPVPGSAGDDTSTSPDTGLSSSEGASSEGSSDGSSEGGSSDGSSSDTGEVACAPDEAPLTFTRSVYPTLLRAGCTVRACHAADDSVSGTLDAAYTSLLDSAVVPGSAEHSPLLDYLVPFTTGSPTTFNDDDLARVAAWIDAGAALGEPPVPDCGFGEPISYAEIVAPIFAGSGCNNGVQCHAKGGIYPEITHAGLVDAPAQVDAGWTLVVPGNVDESSLAWHLTNSALPAGIIDKRRIAVVDAWIRSGALP